MPWMAAITAVGALLEHDEALRRAIAEQQNALNQINGLQNAQWGQLGAQNALNQQNANTAQQYQQLQNAANQQIAGLQNAMHAGLWNNAAFAQYLSASIEETEEQKAAKVKARTLLLDQLDETQRASFEKSESFDCIGKDGKAYKIEKRRSFNVTGPDGAKYCGQTPDAPLEDQMLAQKLLLEHCPDKFFKSSNKLGANGETGTIRIDALFGWAIPRL